MSLEHKGELAEETVLYHCEHALEADGVFDRSVMEQDGPGGGWIRRGGMREVCIAVFADVPSATMGGILYESLDGKVASVSYHGAMDEGEEFLFEWVKLHAPYFRFEYTNGPEPTIQACQIHVTGV